MPFDQSENSIEIILIAGLLTYYASIIFLHPYSVLNAEESYYITGEERGKEKMIEIQMVSGETTLVIHIKTYQL